MISTMTMLYFSGGPCDGLVFQSTSPNPPGTLVMRSPTSWAEKTTDRLSQHEGDDALYVVDPGIPSALEVAK
jgi:hypothetical protein